MEAGHETKVEHRDVFDIVLFWVGSVVRSFLSLCCVASVVCVVPFCVHDLVPLFLHSCSRRCV